jgi:hypothetical protein
LYDEKTLRSFNQTVKNTLDKQPNLFVKLDEAGNSYGLCKLENK